MRNVFFSFFVILSFFLSIKVGFSQGDKNISMLSPSNGELQILGLGPFANEQAVLDDPLIPQIIQHIHKKYEVHTIILYGSRARGMGIAKGDYEIIALQRSGDIKKDRSFLKGVPLNIAIYPDNYGEVAVFYAPLLWQDAVVLYQPHHEGEQFTKALKKAYDYNQNVLSQRKKNLIRILTVNFGRGQKDEIRDHFYRRKFLTLALVKYCDIYDLHDMDPGQTLEWLRKNDLLAYAVFDKALTPKANNEDLDKLLLHIAGSDLDEKAYLKIKIKNQKSPTNNDKIKETYVFSKDALLPKITRHIQKKYGAHTIILYGSRAQGTANSKSDYDIFVIRDPKTQRDNIRDLFKGVYLDLHIFPEEILNDKYLTSSLAIVEGAVILAQKDQIGERLIQHIKNIYDQGFFPSDEIKQKIINEIRKKQSKIKDTPEGYFYQNSLLTSLLQYYFTLRNLYFIGSRESFRWLKKNDLASYQAFEKALKPDASIKAINKLVDRVIEGAIFDKKEAKVEI